MTKPISLIPTHQTRPAEDPIFGLNAEATERRARGESVVNATVGALLDDEGRLAVLPSSVRAVHEVPAEEWAAYAPIAGTPGLHQGGRRLALRQASRARGQGGRRRHSGRLGRAPSRHRQLPRAGPGPAHFELLLGPLRDARRRRGAGRDHLHHVHAGGAARSGVLRAGARPGHDHAEARAPDDQRSLPQPHRLLDDRRGVEAGRRDPRAPRRARSAHLAGRHGVHCLRRARLLERRCSTPSRRSSAR